jgi:phosphatidylserine decarboxylase
MGSTVVMVWEENSVEINNLLNQSVKFGEKIASKK